MMRFFRILLGGLAMMTVALLSAFLTMRLAIHGREVEVPDFSGLTIVEAGEKGQQNHLNLNLENRYYSTVVPAGRVLQQYPAPGTKVRRQWVVRVTESLGPQRVAIPDVSGMQEREAIMALRRQSLDQGTVALLEAPGDAGRVLAQTPPPNAEGVEKPSVSLLLSESPSTEPVAYVMPNLVGQTFGQAQATLTAMGVRANVQSLTAPQTDDDGQPVVRVITGATVMTQSPAPGGRVVMGSWAKLTLNR